MVEPEPSVNMADKDDDDVKRHCDVRINNVDEYDK